jgi:hypothetical protein
VNKAVLSFPPKGMETLRVSLKEDEAGYKILLA